MLIENEGVLFFVFFYGSTSVKNIFGTDGNKNWDSFSSSADFFPADLNTVPHRSMRHSTLSRSRRAGNNAL
jgi:hypothetical protein